MPGPLRLRLVAAVVIIAAAGCAHSTNSDLPPSPLQGDWVYNVTESQRPEAAIRGRNNGAGGSGGAMDGGRGGQVGGAGVGGRGRGPIGGRPGGGGADPEKMRSVMQLLAATRGPLKVEQTDTSVTLTWENGLPLPLRTNGKGVKRTLPGMGEVETKAEWKDGLLIVEQKLDGGIEVRREFVRGPDSPRLIVITKVSGVGPGNLSFRSVYDRVEAGSVPSGPPPRS